jgi:hypothetical protein
MWVWMTWIYHAHMKYWQIGEGLIWKAIVVMLLSLKMCFCHWKCTCLIGSWTKWFRLIWWTRPGWLIHWRWTCCTCGFSRRKIWWWIFCLNHVILSMFLNEVKMFNQLHLPMTTLFVYMMLLLPTWITSYSLAAKSYFTFPIVLLILLLSLSSMKVLGSLCCLVLHSKILYLY